METIIRAIAAEIAAGDSLSIVDLARRFDLSPSTVYRWAVRGLKNPHGVRVKLEVIRLGKSWRTSVAAVQRFLAALPHGETAPVEAPIRSPSQRERDSARAEAALKTIYGI